MNHLMDQTLIVMRMDFNKNKTQIINNSKSKKGVCHMAKAIKKTPKNND